MKFHVQWEESRSAEPYPIMSLGVIVPADDPTRAALTVAQYMNRQGDYYVTELPTASGEVVPANETLRVLITLQAYKYEGRDKR